MTSSLCIHHIDVPLGPTCTRAGTPLLVSFDTLQHMMAHAQNLKDTIQALRNTSSNTQIRSTHVQTELSYTEDSADELRDFLDACWELIPVVKRPSARSAVVAQKVFDTPELLENIFVHLDIFDALKVQQVGRVWRDGINSLVQMQRAMGLRMHEDANFSTPLAYQPWMRHSDVRFPGVTFDGVYNNFDLHEAYLNNHISQTQAVGIRVSTSVPLSVGARCRNILICQPPLKRATVRVVHLCLRNRCAPTMYEYEIRSDDGIRLGDVLDAAPEALDGLCPYGKHAGSYHVNDTEDLYDYDPAGGFESDSGKASGGVDQGGENSKVVEDDDGGDSSGDARSDAGSDLDSTTSKALGFFTHTDCKLSIVVHGTVTLRDDDPKMGQRRQWFAEEADFQERKRRLGSTVSFPYSDYS